MAKAPRCKKCRIKTVLVVEDDEHDEQGFKCPKCDASYLVATGPKSPSWKGKPK